MDHHPAATDHSSSLLEERVLWGMAKYVQTDKGHAFRFVWRRVLLFCFCSLLALWLLKSAAIFCFFRYSRGYTEITVVDSMLFPVNRRALATKFGDKQIQDARELLDSGDIQKALFLLRTGLGRSPSNRDARMILASLMQTLGREEVVLDLYQGGLKYHSEDPLYVRTYLQALFDYRMDGRLREYAEQRLGALTKEPTDADKVVAYSLACLDEATGRLAESVALIERYELQNLSDGCVLLARNHWHCGNRGAAVEILNRFILEHPRAVPETVYQSLYQYLVEDGRARESSLCAMNYANAAPRSPVARRMFIASLFREGNRQRTEVEMARYLNDFQDRLDALAQLFEDKRTIFGPRFARDVYATAMEGKGSPGSFGILLCEALAEVKAYDEVIRICDMVEHDKPTWFNRVQEPFDYLRILAAEGKGQPRVAEIHLDAILNSDTVTPQTMLVMARGMRRHGLDAYALTLLRHARSLAPRNEEILAEMIQIQMEKRMDDNFTANVGDLLALRSPDYVMLTTIRERLVSDHFILDDRRDAVLEQLDGVIHSMDEARATLPRL
jgi:hypothetical protein